ncbi:hypothetical protein [Salinibacter phage M8CRM-1]|uniref:Uncharacterized protein n=1 Tax=Salinibacter phage M8CRM-1 TaxID=2681612 RepID=A0A2I6UGP0_9CAUD|nr:hypothetical protein FGG67_gp68 [Salinibacter phage M8CRM-1]AUO79154.1 hypothetical protein [Salinibacter phage M8CRM-1]
MTIHANNLPRSPGRFIRDAVARNGGITVTLTDTPGRYAVGVGGCVTSELDNGNINHVWNLGNRKPEANAFGIWRDGANYYLDAVKTTDDYDEAFRLAKKYDELAIFDREQNREIRTDTFAIA